MPSWRYPVAWLRELAQSPVEDSFLATWVIHFEKFNYPFRNEAAWPMLGCRMIVSAILRPKNLL